MKRDILRKISYMIATAMSVSLLFTACSSDTPVVEAPSTQTPANNTPGNSEGADKVTDNTTPDASPVKGSRDNTPNCLVPEASGELVSESDTVSIDYSHSSDGYICVKYTGSIPKIKLRITGPDEVVYTYDLTKSDYEVFPLTGGNGSYSVAIYENIEGTNYVTAYFDTIDVAITDELGAYLYPNQYVNFTPDMKAVSLASDLVYPANNDLEAVNCVYNYIIENITYDYAKAESSPTGYVSDIDAILNSGTGICLDYAAIMCSMLRSQGIPTRLEIGYAADAYHAWISVYIKDIGWVNGIIEFSGNTWTLMDPTFGASTDDATLKKFIGDGTNYTLQKIY